MPDAVDARRELVHELEEHPLVDEVDFTRDGYQTLVLQLGEPALREDDGVFARTWRRFQSLLGGLR